jgi:hypothetical protein
MREIWDGQCRRRQPIIPLERVTSWNGCQGVSGAEFQLWICLSHLAGQIHDFLRFSVFGLLQIRINHVIECM